jgi:hypothetical protein
MIAMVVRVQSNGGPAGPRLWVKDGGAPNVTLDALTSGALRLNVGGQQVTAPNPNTTKFHVVVARGPAVDLRVDGVGASGGTSTADVSAPGPGVSVCLSTTANDLTLAEAIAVKGAVSTADVVRLESYLKAKFKL